MSLKPTTFLRVSRGLASISFLSSTSVEAAASLLGNYLKINWPF